MDIEITGWNNGRDVLKALRRRVFIEEQGVPEDLEWDADDETAIHFIARDGKRPVGCARLLPDGRFGRMAVLQEYRRHRIGTHLLHNIEKYYQQEMHGRILKANVQAQAFMFYKNNGFSPVAPFNIDAGIVHLPMEKAVGGSHSANNHLLLGKDNLSYRFPFETRATSGLLQIACQQPQREILITITDLGQARWFDKEVASSLVRYLKAARQNHVRILIQKEYPGIADHRLMLLQQRISSRMSVKVNSAVTSDRILLLPYGWIETSQAEVKASFNDRPRTARQVEIFEDAWRTGQTCKEIRRLGI